MLPSLGMGRGTLREARVRANQDRSGSYRLARSGSENGMHEKRSLLYLIPCITWFPDTVRSLLRLHPTLFSPPSYRKG